MPVFVFLAVLALIEIAGFVAVGRQLGIVATLLLVLASAGFGLWLIRRQGIATVRRAVESLNRREAPFKAGFDGLALALAGVLFLIPGFLTDILGFLLLMPPIRDGIWRFLAGRIGPVLRRRTGNPPAVIEGEYQRIEPDRPEIDRDRR